jgi:hypothetical protein
MIVRNRYVHVRLLDHHRDQPLAMETTHPDLDAHRAEQPRPLAAPQPARRQFTAFLLALASVDSRSS